MASQLSSETRRELQQYVDGEISNAELGEWLVQVEYDSDVSAEERDALARVRLALIEVSEGLRPTEDILDKAAAALVLAKPEEPVIALRAGSGTTWEREPELTATPSRVQHVGISP